MHARFGVQRWRRTNNCAEVFEDPNRMGERPFYDEKKNETGDESRFQSRQYLVDTCSNNPKVLPSASSKFYPLLLYYIQNYVWKVFTISPLSTPYSFFLIHEFYLFIFDH
jgi:hypothetical protein